MLEEIEISGTRVPSGSKKSGLLHVGEVPSSKFSIPFTVINGRKDGPILTVISGQHGTEYDAIAIALEMIRRVTPENLQGCLIVVPVVNILGFDTRTRVEFPVDDRSNGRVQINSIWPGDSNGSLPLITVDKLFREVVMKSQYFIDLHGGDIYESMTPMTMVTQTGNTTVDEASQAVAEVLGFEYVVKSVAAKSRGVSRTEASLAGVPAVLVEIGGKGQITDRLIERGIEGLLNVMKYLKMLEGNATRRQDYRTIYRFVRIWAKSGGLFRQKIPTGSMVEEGSKIGEIVSLDGASSDVFANASGVLIEAFNNPAVFTGEVLAEIAVVHPPNN